MLNIIDLVVFLVLVIFTFQGYHTGLVGGLLNLLTTLLAFLAALFLYPYFGDFLSKRFGLAAGFATILAFFLILIFVEIVLSFVTNYIYKHLVTPFHRRFRKFVKIDQWLGILPALLVGTVLVSLFFLLPLVLPINAGLRSQVSRSWWGENVLAKIISYQPKIEKYLNRLPYQNLIFLLTPSPDSEESIKLSIPAQTVFQIDPESETKMLELVNQERTSRGLKQVAADDNLRKVSRDHCLDMFQRSYFSHYTPEGKSPFDRMKEFGIKYSYAGENLAYAPSVNIAHEGLMNSTGHRENILRDEFGHLGVGVIDGGFSGKMLCQEFTD